jgi:hypothetical protein
MARSAIVDSDDFEAALRRASVGNLRAHFRRHGRPLLLKRDNGSLFNCGPIDQLLSDEAVIPFNSPAYYPRYNGGIEP